MVLDKIDSIGYCKMRQELAEKMSQRRETVYKMVTDQNFIISEDTVESLTETRPKYFSYLVLECEKRLLDLYKIERDFNFGFRPRKNFKLLLFKEKLMSEKSKDINSKLENMDKSENLISEVVDKYGRTEKEERYDRGGLRFDEQCHKDLSMYNEPKKIESWVF